MESYLRSSSPPESKKKAAGSNSPSSLADVSKSSHKSNKRSSIIARIQVGASTFWTLPAECSSKPSNRQESRCCPHSAPNWNSSALFFSYFQSTVSNPFLCNVIYGAGIASVQLGCSGLSRSRTRESLLSTGGFLGDCKGGSLDASHTKYSTCSCYDVPGGPDGRADGVCRIG